MEGLHGLEIVQDGCFNGKDNIQRNTKCQNDGSQRINERGYYKCSICVKTYSNSRSVYPHLSIKHGILNNFKQYIISPYVFSATNNSKQDQNNNQLRLASSYLKVQKLVNQIVQKIISLLRLFYEEVKQCQITQKNIQYEIFYSSRQDSQQNFCIQIDQIDQQKLKESKRRIQINNKTKYLKKHYQIQQINYLVGKIPIDYWNITKPLRKFLSNALAAKIQFSLQIIYGLGQLQIMHLWSIMREVLDQIWYNMPKIKDQLFIYCSEWKQIVFGHKQSFKEDQVGNKTSQNHKPQVNNVRKGRPRKITKINA